MSNSCQPDRCSAYADDLRWRMVWQREALGYSYDKISSNLCVDRSTVWRTVQLFLTTGNVAKRPYPKENAYRKLTKPAQLLIMHLILKKPGIYLHEIKSEILETLFIDISVATISNFLSKNGFSRQKLYHTALQQDEFLRQLYISDVSMYSTDMFIFVDETGADRRNTLRKYAYSVRGKPLRNHSLLVRGERVSAIAAISVHGVVDVKTTIGTNDATDFYDFVNLHLLPHLLPFNGSNHHSIVVLDNCAIHHIPEITKVINEVGALVMYLPPYSPDYNPIEEAFSKLKQTIKTLDHTVYDLETLLLIGFTFITSKDCQNWIKHSGIY